MNWFRDLTDFRALYAVGDLHGDVGLVLRIFRDVLQLVAPSSSSVADRWVWVGGPAVCVVICGDVVDRERTPGRFSSPGENSEQDRYPDDLYVLWLLNDWSELAELHGSCIIRLLGNHDVFQYRNHTTPRSLQLLARLEPGVSRSRSFATGEFHRAIWHKSCRIIVQIGHVLLVHGGLTDKALSEIGRIGFRSAITLFYKRVVTAAPAEDGAMESLLLTRENQNGPSVKRVRHLLAKWNAVMRPSVDATVLVTAHNALLQPPRGSILVGGQPSPRRGVCYFTRSSPDGWWSGFGTQYVEGAPWIEAMCVDGDDEPCLYRIDTAQSRAWDMDPMTSSVHRPQLLVFRRTSQNENKYKPWVLYR